MNRILKTGFIAAVTTAVLALPAAGDTVSEEEALDRKLGLSEKPFVFNLAVLRTRLELREAAGVGTGLPNYDQQPEEADRIPVALIQNIRRQRREAQEAREAAAAAQAGADQPAEEEDDVNCYVSPNNVLICE